MKQLKNNQFRRNSKKYKSFYLNRFLQSKFSADYIRMGLCVNAKEVTESMAAFQACEYIPYSEIDDVNMVCVGDGHSPRTAAIFAFRTRWNCHSVDPQLRKQYLGINRLTIYPNKIEDISLEFEKVVIVCVHSHSKLTDCLSSIKGKERHLISIPCCVPDNINNPSYTYIDEDIWSPKNTVRIWNNI